MIGHICRFLGLAVTLGFGSCAKPAHEPAAVAGSEKTQPTAKPEPVVSKPAAKGKITSISLEKAFPLQQSGAVLILDARPGYMFALSRIPGAISIPKSSVDAKIKEHKTDLQSAVAANKPIIVYCTGILCADAKTVANHLADAGYSSSVLQGGWDAWKSSDLPTE